MIFGRDRRKRRERPTDSSGSPNAKSPDPQLSAMLQELQKKHDEVLAELAETQQRTADAGATRRRLEDQLKTLEGRPEAESVAERYEQAKANEKNLLGREREVQKKLDVFLQQKESIEAHDRQLGNLLEAD